MNNDVYVLKNQKKSSAQTSTHAFTQFEKLFMYPDSDVKLVVSE